MSDNNLKIQLKDFKSISLNSLNAKASLLKRMEKKYLLTSKDFIKMLPELKKGYDILEINNKKVFSYDNVYMDTEDYLFYNQHNDRLNSRTKVRTRFYVDSNQAFFEFKHKLNWVTNKYRYEFPYQEHGFMTKGKKRFFDGIWQSIYGTTNVPEITPSLKTNYRRITMVSKRWWERLTFDFWITATNLRTQNAKTIELNNLIIVESKSTRNISRGTRLMDKFWIKRCTSCSKYSLGIIYSWLAQKYDTFKETMGYIENLRMETVKEARKKVNAPQTSLNRIIKDIKQDTNTKVNESITTNTPS